MKTIEWYDGGDGVTYEIWKDEDGKSYHVPIEIVRDFDNAKEVSNEYKTCDRCSYDVLDEDGDILEHHCIDDELYNPQINQ